MNVKDLEDEIKRIKERNKRVESEKAWETSLTRKIILAILTYIVISSFFLVANLQNPFINSIVPTLGFILSTMSLPFFKKLWLRYIHK